MTNSNLIRIVFFSFSSSPSAVRAFVVCNNIKETATKKTNTHTRCLFIYLCIFICMPLHCWLIYRHHRFIQAHDIALKMGFCVCSRFVINISYRHSAKALASALLSMVDDGNTLAANRKSNTDSNYVIIDGNSHFHLFRQQTNDKKGKKICNPLQSGLWIKKNTGYTLSRGKYASLLKEGGEILLLNLKILFHIRVVILKYFTIYR